jgi:hypothetical protein
MENTDRMSPPPVAVALSFVDAINRRDAVGLGELMTDEHALVVFDEPRLVGRAANIEAWNGYMASFPAYVIHPFAIAVRDTQVAIAGTTTGSHLGLPDEEETRQSLIWLCDVEGDAVACWTLVEDTAQRRRDLRLPVGHPDEW